LGTFLAGFCGRALEFHYYLDLMTELIFATVETLHNEMLTFIKKGVVAVKGPIEIFLLKTNHF
jgi:hypothetical protein